MCPAEFSPTHELDSLIVWVVHDLDSLTSWITLSEPNLGKDVYARPRIHHS